MADNLAMKLLIAGVIGAIVGAAASDRYHFPAGLVYGFNTPSGSRQSRPPASPMISSAKAGEVRADETISPPRMMRSAQSGGTEAGRSRPPQWRAPRPGGYGRAAICWREYEDPDFGTFGYFVRCAGAGGRNHRPRGHGRHIRRERPRARLRKADRPHRHGQVRAGCGDEPDDQFRRSGR